MAVTKFKSGSSDPKNAKQSSTMEIKTLPRSRFRSVIKTVTKLMLVVVAFVSYSIIAPLFVAVMIPLYLYRCVVILLQKLLKPDWIGIMSSRDAIVGLDDTSKKCECIIIAAIVFKGDPDINVCRDHFRKHVTEAKDPQGKYVYEKLRHYYENWLGFPFWKREKDFKLESHFRLFDYNVESLQRDEQGRITEDNLLQCFGELETLPFAKGESPWEILIVPNFHPQEASIHKDYHVFPGISPENSADGDERHFALLYRVSHAIGDGYSFLKMLVCNICNEPVDSVPQPPAPKHNFLVTMLNTVAILLFTPYYHLKQFILEIDRSVWHLPANKLTHRSHFAITERIPMESLKEVGKAYKVPLTGVFLTALSGAIHNFLKLNGKGHLRTKYMRAISPMPWKHHPAFSTNGMVNHWTTGIFGIPVAEDTPQKRLLACKRSMRNLVNSPILIVNFYTVPLLLSAPNFLTDLWGTNWMTSMVLSNFPGPKYPTKSFGKYPLDNVFGFVPHMRGSAGLGVMFPTCLGNVRCTVSVDTAVLKDHEDVQLLARLIDEEFRILRSLPLPRLYSEESV